MNREIRFRGKKLDNGEWVYGSLRVIDDSSCHIETKAERILTRYIDGKPFYEIYRKEHEIDPETVGQYTGLRDKNGVKIYEGDIVKGYYYINGVKKRIVGRVVFGYNGWNISGVGHYVRDTIILTSACEVIGMIHDNPELLDVS